MKQGVERQNKVTAWNEEDEQRNTQEARLSRTSTKHVFREAPTQLLVLYTIQGGQGAIGRLDVCWRNQKEEKEEKMISRPNLCLKHSRFLLFAYLA
jgi:hypothetical protein